MHLIMHHVPHVLLQNKETPQSTFCKIGRLFGLLALSGESYLCLLSKLQNKNLYLRIKRILTSYFAVSISEGRSRASGTIMVRTLPIRGSLACLFLLSIPEGPAVPFLGGRTCRSCASIAGEPFDGSFCSRAFNGGIEPIIISIFPDSSL